MAKDCGHKVPCGCKDTPLTTPAPCGDGINCPDATTCSETFDANCIYYTGEDITCDQTTIITTNTTLADAITTMTNLFCGQTQIDANILCGTDVVVAAGRTVENAIADLIAYFCSEVGRLESDIAIINNTLDNLHLFASTTYGVIGVPDGGESPCTTYTHTISYLDDVGTVIDTTQFTTVTCDPVDLCANPVTTIDTDTNLVVCEGGQERVAPVSALLALSPIQGLYTQTADSTTVSGLTEGSLIGTGLGTLTVPSFQFAVGDSFKAKMFGHLTTVNSNATVRIKFNAVTVITLSFGVPNITDLHWVADIEFVIRSIGSTGSVLTAIQFQHEEDAADKFSGHATTQLITLDTNTNNTLDITMQFDNAGDSIYSEVFTLNKVY